jgi:hypothetical protein
MPATVSTTTLPWPILVTAFGVGLLLAGAIGLWAYLGTTIFFEIVRNGWMACF